jgi:prepilin-type N-terminal cleavage/methylation domain-containing protein
MFKKKNKGFTLVEVLISATLLTVIVGGVTSTMLFSTKQAALIEVREEAKTMADVTYDLIKERLTYAGEVYVSNDEIIDDSYDESFYDDGTQFYYNNFVYSGADYVKVNYDITAYTTTMEVDVYVLNSKDEILYETSGVLALDTLSLAGSSIEGTTNTTVTNPYIYFNNDYDREPVTGSSSSKIVVDGDTSDWASIEGFYQNNNFNPTWSEYVNGNLVFHMHDGTEEYDVTVYDMYGANKRVEYTKNNVSYSYPMVSIASYYPVNVYANVNGSSELVALNNINDWKKSTYFGYVNNNANMHKIQLACDDENVYIRVSFAKNYGARGNFDAINLTVTGKNGNVATITPLSAQGETGSLSNNTGFSLGVNKVKILYTNNNEVGYGYYILKPSGESSELEICIPLSSLQQYNPSFSNIDAIQAVTLNSCNITCTGWGIVSCTND